MVRMLYNSMDGGTTVGQGGGATGTTRYSRPQLREVSCNIGTLDLIPRKFYCCLVKCYNYHNFFLKKGTPHPLIPLTGVPV